MSRKEGCTLANHFRCGGVSFKGVICEKCKHNRRNASCNHPNRDTCKSHPGGPACGDCQFNVTGGKPCRWNMYIKLWDPELKVIVTKEDISKDTTIEIIDNEAYQVRICNSCGKSMNPQFYSGYLDKFKDGERTSVRESVDICCDCFVKLTGKEVR